MFIVTLCTPSAVLMHFVLFCCLLFSSSFLGFKFIKCMRRFINFHSVDCCSCTGTMVWVQRGLSCKYVCICVFLFVCLYLCLCLYISTWVFVYIIYVHNSEFQWVWVERRFWAADVSGPLGCAGGLNGRTLPSSSTLCTARHTAQCTMHDIHCTRYKVQCIVHTGLNGRTLHKYVIQCTVNTYMPYMIVSMDGPWLHPPHSQCTSFT